MRRAPLLCTLAGLLGTAGCTTANTASTGDFSGAEGDVAKVVGDLRTAGRRKDGDKICSQLLARSLVSRLDSSGTACRQEMTKAARDADEFALDVRDVTVTGDQATAKVQRGSDGPSTTFRFVREAGRWKISELSG
jgi:hypothetical protein